MIIRVAIAAFLLCFNLFAEDPDATPAQQLYPEATLSLTPPNFLGTARADFSPASASGNTNSLVPSPVPEGMSIARPAADGLPGPIVDFFASTNSPPGMSDRELLVHQKRRLEVARYLRTSRQINEAEIILVELMGDKSPEDVQQAALLELAAAAQDQNNLPRAQQVYAQFLAKWSNDARVPEILLRQGLLYRKMGLYNLAFTKYYGVMTSALVLKNDQMEYYVRLVQQAQTQIAETHYELGKYAEAADFFSRLLKQSNTNINKSQVLYKLARCHAALGKHAEAVADAQDFLVRFPEAPEQPEIRFHLAVALKQLGRDNESLQQVLMLLQEQRELTRNRPDVWAYWQQRTGNLIANQLYREGEYSRALEIYLNLAQLDPSLSWQLPLNYQIGMTYERLWQPQKATEIYNQILNREKELGPTPAPGMKAVLDMVRWRIKFIEWQNKAEAANRQLYLTATNRSETAGLSPRPIP